MHEWEKLLMKRDILPISDFHSFPTSLRVLRSKLSKLVTFIAQSRHESVKFLSRHRATTSQRRQGWWHSRLSGAKVVFPCFIGNMIHLKFIVQAAHRPRNIEKSKEIPWPQPVTGETVKWMKWTWALLPRFWVFGRTRVNPVTWQKHGKQWKGCHLMPRGVDPAKSVPLHPDIWKKWSLDSNN